MESAIVVKVYSIATTTESVGIIEKTSQGEDSLIHQPIAQGNRHIMAPARVAITCDRAPIEISAAKGGTEKIPAGIVNQLVGLGFES
jgi:hypothetical protein